jgi:ATP-binding cassette subfamily B protein
MHRLRRLLPYFRSQRRAYVLALGGVVLATATGVVTPELAGRLIDHLKRGATSRDVLLWALAIVGFAAVRAVFLFWTRSTILSSARRIEYGLRNDLFAHLETLSAAWYDRNPTGEVTSRMINDLEGVRMMAGFGVMGLAATGLLFAASVAIMVWRNPLLAALAVAPLVGVSAVMAWTAGKMHDLSLAIQSQLGILSARAQENFQGARVVRAFAQEENEVSRFRSDCAEYAGRNVRLARWRSGSWAAILLLAEGAMVLTLFVGGRGIVDGTVTEGTLTTFAAYQFQLLWPMVGIGWVVGIVQRGLACLGRLDEILDARPESDDSRALPGSAPIAGRVEARGLTFAYSPERPPALRDVSFTVEPGQKVAIVGRTGSGKTTLVQLLLRHYRVPDATLFVDGRDVNAIPLAELRGAMGVVPQDLFLFSDTLEANVLFGLPRETGNGEREALTRRAVELSRLSSDLDQFPDGIEQRIGERGVTLSGGQKQRTAIARALVREPRILVLDDALSSVDAHTEREIRDGLRGYMKGRTTLVVTHRLSAVVDADLILVLEEGRLVERGRHAELAAAGGPYARLWESQKLVEELAGA